MSHESSVAIKLVHHDENTRNIWTFNSVGYFFLFPIGVLQIIEEHSNIQTKIYKVKKTEQNLERSTM